MKIVADENIPFAKEAFGRIGEVILLSGFDINKKSVKEADALIVRSVTKVNKELLDGSNVKFVGTATIGTDHIDIQYLNANNISFASAPGSNANSVAEYVFSGLSVISRNEGICISNKTIGIIGVGNVGSRVSKKAMCLGMDIVKNDPPLKELTGSKEYMPLKEIFECDIITIHTPLAKSPPYPTYHMADKTFFSKVKPGTIFINTSRGYVVDTKALKHAICSHKLKAIIDVWENEPDIDTDLLKYTTIGTPHIAGYSYDGKVKGTEMMYKALCNFFNIDDPWSPGQLVPKPTPSEISPDLGNKINIEEIIKDIILKVYDVREDDNLFRKMLEIQDSKERSRYFNYLRKNYRKRREIWAMDIKLKNASPEIKSLVNIFISPDK